MRIHVFTSAAANYLPKVRVLFDSLAAHHPEWQRHLLLVEDWPATEIAAVDLDAEIHQPRDLDIPDWRPWAFCHSIVELCTAVKPFLLKQLLAREDCDAVVYLDPDIYVFSSLDEVVSACAAHSVLLTPHQATPETTLAGVMANELTSLRYGTYNLGFIAVSASEVGQRFAQWWSQRAYRFNRDDVANGLFTDQRWMDLVPGLFEGVGVLRQPRLNVASWNAHLRGLEVSSQGEVTVSGAPLGFYHFTGLDSGNHELARVYAGDLGEAGGHLLQNYREALARNARQYSYPAWTFGHFSDGQAIEPSWRRAYRDDATLQARFPDPWSAPGIVEALIGATAREAKPGFISPGFEAGGAGGVNLTYLGQQVVQVAKRPSQWGSAFRAARRILGREGWKGLRRRMSRSSGESM